MLLAVNGTKREETAWRFHWYAFHIQARQADEIRGAGVEAELELL